MGAVPFAVPVPTFKPQPVAFPSAPDHAATGLYNSAPAWPVADYNSWSMNAYSGNVSVHLKRKLLGITNFYNSVRDDQR